MSPEQMVLLLNEEDLEEITRPLGFNEAAFQAILDSATLKEASVEVMAQAACYAAFFALKGHHDIKHSYQNIAKNTLRKRNVLKHLIEQKTFYEHPPESPYADWAPYLLLLVCKFTKEIANTSKKKKEAIPNPVHMAAFLGENRTLEYLYKLMPENFEKLSHTGERVAEIAGHYGHQETVEVLRSLNPNLVEGLANTISSAPIQSVKRGGVTSTFWGREEPSITITNSSFSVPLNPYHQLMQRQQKLSAPLIRPSFQLPQFQMREEPAPVDRRLQNPLPPKEGNRYSDAQPLPQDPPRSESFHQQPQEFLPHARVNTQGWQGFSSNPNLGRGVGQMRRGNTRAFAQRGFN